MPFHLIFTAAVDQRLTNLEEYVKLSSILMVMFLNFRQSQAVKLKRTDIHKIEKSNSE
jgi:hypothetical protein